MRRPLNFAKPHFSAQTGWIGEIFRPEKLPRTDHHGLRPPLLCEVGMLSPTFLPTTQQKFQYAMPGILYCGKI